MTISPTLRPRLRGILDNMSEHLASARNADTAAVLRKAVNDLYFGLNDLSDLANRAEREDPVAVEYHLAKQALETQP